MLQCFTIFIPLLLMKYGEATLLQTSDIRMPQLYEHFGQDNASVIQMPYLSRHFYPTPKYSDKCGLTA